MFKIKVPKQIKILTHTYQLSFDIKPLLSAGTCGLTSHTYQIINLEPKLPPSELNQTFLHEVLHTIERHFNVKMDDPDVDRIAEGLAIFLFENLDIQLDWSDIEGRE